MINRKWFLFFILLYFLGCADAILVGEPIGARPNGYQENRGTSLPNSHLGLSYSIQLYKFSEQNTPSILPDRKIEPDWKSFQAGRDAALEWILKFSTADLSL